MTPRRTFFKQLAGLTAGFAILPAATTYERIWRPKTIEPVWVINPEWVNATYEIGYIMHPDFMAILQGPVRDIATRMAQLIKSHA